MSEVKLEAVDEPMELATLDELDEMDHIHPDLGEESPNILQEMERELDVPFQQDPVTGEVPIYLNGSVGDNLVVLQYPTRPKSVDSRHVHDFKLKPKSQVVEVNVETELGEAYLDPSHLSSASETALRSQPYQGILKPAEGYYAVGRLSEEAFYLSVVSRIGQLRPHFASDDVQESRPTSSSTGVSSIGSSGSASTTAGQQIRSVQLSVKSTTDQTSKISGVLEFWKHANQEAYDQYEYEQGDLKESIPDAADLFEVPNSLFNFN